MRLAMEEEGGGEVILYFFNNLIFQKNDVIDGVESWESD